MLAINYFQHRQTTVNACSTITAPTQQLLAVEQEDEGIIIEESGRHHYELYNCSSGSSVCGQHTGADAAAILTLYIKG